MGQKFSPRVASQPPSEPMPKAFEAITMIKEDLLTKICLNKSTNCQRQNVRHEMRMQMRYTLVSPFLNKP